MRYKVWHAECDSESEAEIYDGDDENEVADKILFVYYAGDCDSGADEVNEDDTHPGRFIATRKGSPDYFYIKKDEHAEG